MTASQPPLLDDRIIVPESRNLAVLREQARGCRNCELYRNATQTVFGEGPSSARIVLVGEQPGDREDKEGRPFVGPAGRVLERALRDAGIAREDAYVTNAVKHFKWQPRGKRRIHQKPNRSEIRACQPWLFAELESLRPLVVVALGATAAQSLLGIHFVLTKERGRVLPTPWSQGFVATVHPSSLLRIEDEAERDSAYEAFTHDLRIARDAMAKALVE
jgi:DNA polymerase